MKLKHYGWKVTVQQILVNPDTQLPYFGPEDEYTGEGLERTLNRVLVTKKRLMKKAA